MVAFPVAYTQPSNPSPPKFGGRAKALLPLADLQDITGRLSRVFGEGAHRNAHDFLALMPRDNVVRVVGSREQREIGESGLSVVGGRLEVADSEKLGAVLARRPMTVGKTPLRSADGFELRLAARQELIRLVEAEAERTGQKLSDVNRLPDEELFALANKSMERAVQARRIHNSLQLGPDPGVDNHILMAMDGPTWEGKVSKLLTSGTNATGFVENISVVSLDGTNLINSQYRRADQAAEGVRRAVEGAAVGRTSEFGEGVEYAGANHLNPQPTGSKLLVSTRERRGFDGGEPIRPSKRGLVPIAEARLTPADDGRHTIVETGPDAVKEYNARKPGQRVFLTA